MTQDLFLNKQLNQQILQQEPKYIGGGKYSLRKKLLTHQEQEDLMNFAEIDASENSIEQKLTKAASKTSKKPHSLLPGGRRGASKVTRNIQSANLKVPRDKLMGRVRD